MFEGLFWYSIPFLLLSVILLVWAWVTSKMEYKYPRYFKFAQKVYELLPKIAVVIIVIAYIYF